MPGAQIDNYALHLYIRKDKPLRVQRFGLRTPPNSFYRCRVIIAPTMLFHPMDGRALRRLIDLLNNFKQMYSQNHEPRR
jgi:hypothetical protein